MGEGVVLVDECSMDGDDCRATRCCKQAGSQCFQKNWRWASCHQTCQWNMDWDFATRSWVSTGNEKRWDCTVLQRPMLMTQPKQVDQPIDIVVHQTVEDGAKQEAAE